MQPTNQDEPTRSGHLGSLRCDQSKTGTAIASIKAQILIAMGGGTIFCGCLSILLFLVNLLPQEPVRNSSILAKLKIDTQLKDELNRFLLSL